MQESVNANALVRMRVCIHTHIFHQMHSHPYPHLAKSHTSCAFAYASDIASLPLKWWWRKRKLSIANWKRNRSKNLPLLHLYLKLQSFSSSLTSCWICMTIYVTSTRMTSLFFFRASRGLVRVTSLALRFVPSLNSLGNSFQCFQSARSRSTLLKRFLGNQKTIKMVSLGRAPVGRRVNAHFHSSTPPLQPTVLIFLYSELWFIL